MTCLASDAKLKMKVGVVSTAVEQHTEGRLHDSQSDVGTLNGRVQRGASTFTRRSLAMFLREGRIEIVFRQDESCGQNLNTAVQLFLGRETSKSPWKEVPERCV